MSDYTKTYNTIEKVYNKINESGINAYMVGGISSAIQANKDLYRQNQDIDLMVEEKDLSKLIEILQEIGYKVEDKRKKLTGNKVDKNGNFQPRDHELNADTESQDMLGIGIFLFERKNGVVIRNSYTYDEKEKAYIGTRKIMPEELFDLMYSNKKINYKGTNVKCQTKEYTFLSKSKGNREKDKEDASVIEEYIEEEERKTIDRIKILQNRVEEYRIKYDEEGNEYIEKIPSMEDKIENFISEISSQNVGKTPEEIKKIVIDNESVKEYMKEDKDIENIMTILGNTEIPRGEDITAIAKKIAHNYFYEPENIEVKNAIDDLKSLITEWTETDWTKFENEGQYEKIQIKRLINKNCKILFKYGHKVEISHEGKLKIDGAYAFKYQFIEKINQEELEKINSDSGNER